MSRDRFNMSRRGFLARLGTSVAAGSLAACGDDDTGAGTDPSSSGTGLDLERNPPPPAPAIEPPFALGVASGDPLHDRVVIWTRLAPAPLESDWGMPAEDVPVIWEVFADEALTEPVRSGWTRARPALAHAVHVDVDGLRSDTPYWYRFRVGDDHVSPVGRTRTFPRPDASPRAFRFAMACCQKYRSGFYTAYHHLAREEDLHAVFHLGDYIYESGGEPEVPGRLPLDRERVTDLAGFRHRYGAYRLDEDLQEAHRVHPWIATWDDHEVSNNYGSLTLAPNRRGDGDPAAIRAAGYQAWYEHMPVRMPFPDDPTFLRIYRDFHFGTLARIFVLDSRQYRTPQACDDEVGPACDEIFDPERTMLGHEQKAWLVDGLRHSDSRWNIMAQQVLFGPFNLDYSIVNPDQWDGYVHARQQILDVLAEPDVHNPVVLSGDVHAAGFSVLRADAEDDRSPVIGHEILTTSISSGGDELDGIARFAPLAEVALDNVDYVEAGKRGYALCELTRNRLDVRFRVVTTVAAPTADVYVDRAYRIWAEQLTFERRRDWEDEPPG
ncbi:MAG: alkaline phosphatase [Deltaproteobacteria bacterium]|nr:MAG: alkaline phosphatase [Deltaproteobacteria bacterium]